MPRRGTNNDPLVLEGGIVGNTFDMRLARSILSGVGDLIFPPSCALCRSMSADADRLATLVCAECRTDWLLAERVPSCPRCAGTIGPHELSAGLCATCRREPPRVAGTARIGAYQGRLADAVRRYKYDGREDLHPLLSEGLVAAVRAAPWLSRMEVVTYVPTHWRRQLLKPFYTAERLARTLADQLDLPLVTLLRRTRAGFNQVGLSPTARKANVRGAFETVRGVELHAAQILLVDDVKTTGATMEECARVLKAAGAGEVCGAVLSRAEWTPALDQHLDISSRTAR